MENKHEIAVVIDSRNGEKYIKMSDFVSFLIKEKSTNSAKLSTADFIDSVVLRLNTMDKTKA